MPPDFQILLVDDSRSDALIVARALRESGEPHGLAVARDGQDALGRLARPEGRPDLVLLDLNLPGLDGFQILAAIRSDPALRAIPVVVLTTSGRDEDVERASRLGADGYLRKPDEYPPYRDLVAALLGRWRRGESPDDPAP